jgi:phosphoribosyl-dephospho-CoA transferase
MKTETLNKGLVKTANALEIVLNKVLYSLKLSTLDSNYNNNRVYEILENKGDEIKVNNTIEELKKSKENKSQTIELSNHNFLVVSIE